MFSESRKREVHFATLTDFCHLLNVGIEPKHRQKGPIVLRETIKDVSGVYVVFIEQGSSSSQITAAKKRVSLRDYQMRWTSRRRNIDKKKSPNGKWRMLLGLGSKVSRFLGYVFHNTLGQNPGQKIADPMVLLERTSRQNARAVLRHGRTCSEVWRGNLNWQTKRRSSFAQLQRWSQFQGGLCWTRYSSRTISLYPLCGLRGSLQQGHFLPWHQRQIDLPSWYQARRARSYCWRRTGMGFTRRSFTCFISSQILRAIMISQEVDLVVGDFNGTAWWCRSRDDNSYWWSFLLIVLCLRHWAPHRWGDLDPTRTTQQTSVDLSTSLALSVSGK